MQLTKFKMFRVQTNVVQFFNFSKNLSFGKFLVTFRLGFTKPNIIGNNGKNKLFMKNFKLLQNFDKVKLSKNNILLSFKTIVIVSIGSFFF